MSEGYRKLRVLLNTKHPRRSRVVDVESGEDLLVTDIQIDMGYRNTTRLEMALHFTVTYPGFEIMLDEPLEVPEQPQ
jgi:hypothetical protein